ncbi:MAG: nucleoside-triphosphatase, partial [Candidatus Bathyarchaeales archaeon]
MRTFEKRVLLLTGSPGIGKTTVLLKASTALKAKGYSVGGMISREVRLCGTRVGFEILDLKSGTRGWLAHVNQPTGPQVGKYR